MGNEQPAPTEALLTRHQAFWEMAPVEAPLLRIGRYQPLQRRQPLPLADGSLTQEGQRLRPELLDMQRLTDMLEEPSLVVNGDLLGSVAPTDLCWNEAIAGCPIRWRAGHVWSEPVSDHLDDLDRLRVSPDNPWLAKLVEWAGLLGARAGGRYPIGQPLLRGPIDIAAAVVGDEPLCWLMADEPAQFRRLLDRCTDLFITTATAWLAAVAPFRNGSCQYGIWAPGATVRTQADNAALLSPRLYREFLLPCDRRICAAFDYPLIHTHSGVLPIIVDVLLELPALRAIQAGFDYPAGPSVAELLPHLRKVSGRKPLIITGGVTREELDLMLASLSPQGLCLQVDLREDEPNAPKP